jgi:hypothetical protein
MIVGFNILLPVLAMFDGDVDLTLHSKINKNDFELKILGMEMQGNISLIATVDLPK